MITAAILLCACGAPGTDEPAENSMSEALMAAETTSQIDIDETGPIVTGSWHSIMIQTPDMEDIARFWVEIGQYETVDKNGFEWTLKAPGTKDGFITLKESESPDELQIRSADARAWDTGCYWSIMMRAKNIESIVEDARDLGWEPLTDIAFLEFGPSRLHIVVLTHLETGTRVQLYERLTTPLPANFPDFDRVSRPFNIMQMVKDRDVSYRFFKDSLGFETFHHGDPFLASEPVINPLGIPKHLTTSIPYKATIVYPKKGMEWGRFEMIEIEGMEDAKDYSGNCRLENDEFNYGTIGVLYRVPDNEPIKRRLANENIPFQEYTSVQTIPGIESTVIIDSPDGAIITFAQTASAK